MMTDKRANIIWLASYPKSGNTWLRAFLINLFSGQEAPVHINDFGNYCYNDYDSMWYAPSALDTESVTEAMMYRRAAMEKLSSVSESPIVVNTHCPNLAYDGMTYIPQELTQGVIYVTRNPLDIAPSLMNHFGLDEKEAIAMMIDDAHVAGLDENSFQYILGSWNLHVVSWMQDPPFPALFLRYEDMIANPGQAFRHVAHFLRLTHSDAEIDRAITNSSFDVLQAMEAANGYVQNAGKQAFFDQGKPNAIRHKISELGTARLFDNCKTVMDALDYAFFDPVKGQS